MIHLEQATVLKPGTQTPILRDVTVQFRSRDRVGILAAIGSGKSTIARLLCGVELPDAGHVYSENVSWPLGYAGFLHPSLSVAKNLALIARFLGQDPVTYVGLVCHLAEVSPLTQVQNLSPSQRAALAYMCAIAVPGRMLIADDKLTVGDVKMQRKSKALLEQRLQSEGLVMLSRNPRQMAEYCTRIFALVHGRLIPCETAQRAQFLLTKEVEHA